MIRRPPRSTRTDTLFPYTTLFRSGRSPRTDWSVSSELAAWKSLTAVERSAPFHGAPTFPGWHPVQRDLPPPVVASRIPDHVRCRRGNGRAWQDRASQRSEEHTSELQSLMRISYAVFCLKKKKQ